MWIYQQADWPHFTWDDQVLKPKLDEFRHKRDRLHDRMGQLSLGQRREAAVATLTDDLVKSFEIENVFLDPEAARSSITKQLGFDFAGLKPADRKTDLFVEMLLDATQNYSAPLTQERLFDWHQRLFHEGPKNFRTMTIGAWRVPSEDPMHIVSVSGGREKIHFVAPPAEKLDHEMRQFLDWFEDEQDIDPVLKAGLAHLWFVTVHPFADGNGRTARAIGDMALARAEGTAERFYSVSAQIMAERKGYYACLEQQQKTALDATNWLAWFVGCVTHAIDHSDAVWDRAALRSRFWEHISLHPLNERQSKIIHRMFDLNFVGHMNTSKYAKMAHCSPATATRDIQGLKERGILVQNSGGGRSTSYRLFDPEDLSRVT